ncbi:conserved hypothetical protein [Talaromyces stipitatus ATCC 10500]|uniref:Uncharacterized protein n=1 Tax=Talaromyces stipitatus (strain ATCC 10500 / CBS 375.48 / QM 6759 / NRRL 1006) TaxID=441959 RepID=B8M014_TALSN|nr:uncharacterized protein TSTA_081790 [Talaromyces stipitatus ATCC 10500]EED20946.1 conserved hypothetical protein [Talaromyces stipitatus ATCC 10500]
MTTFHLEAPIRRIDPPQRAATDITIRTRYMIMLLEYDRGIPFSHTCMAAVSQWTLLAGYLVVPGTFTSLQRLNEFSGASATVVRAIQNPPLLAIACICFFAGASAMSWLAWRWRFNDIWLSHLFRPTLLNALAGLLTTLVNIYSAQDGDWSIMALLTVILTATVMVVSGTLTAYFYFFKLAEIKKEHEADMILESRLRWRRELELQS